MTTNGASRLFITGWGDEELVDSDRAFLIGRDPAADIALDRDCRRFSRRCVEFQCVGGVWTMRNVSSANTIPYTSGALHAELAPSVSVALERQSYTLYFYLGETVRIDVRLEHPDPADGAGAAAVLGDAPGEVTAMYPELTPRERLVATAILLPLLRDPTLGITSINSNDAAGELIGTTAKGVEHVVKSLREHFNSYEAAAVERRGDPRAERFRLFEFLRRTGIVSTADIGLIVV